MLWSILTNPNLLWFRGPLSNGPPEATDYYARRTAFPVYFTSDMANPEHLAVLSQGVDSWNKWRQENLSITPDLIQANLSNANLREADLSDADLGEADLSKVDLSKADLSGALLNGANLSGALLNGANLSGALLSEADLSGANLSGAVLDKARLRRANLSDANLSCAQLIETDLSDAVLHHADLSGAILGLARLGLANLSSANLSGADLSLSDLNGVYLTGADLTGAKLHRANLTYADLSGANLSGANLSHAILVDTNFENAIINGCEIYGISAWNVNLAGARQDNLVITTEDESTITVDNLEIAQFIHLLLNNEKIREVIDTITSKVVLILGRFTPERKAVLDAIREELRKRNYLPVLFDFDEPTNRDVTETIRTLAHMAHFVIADITDPRSIPQELATIIPHLPSLPVQPILSASQTEYGMFKDLLRYPWVLPLFKYEDKETLLISLGEKVIRPAEAKVIEQRRS
jgi:uncharacterized protein YjbI with pentapeptide repeats